MSLFFLDFARRILGDLGGPNPRAGRKSDQAHPPIHPTKAGTNLQGKSINKNPVKAIAKTLYLVS